MIDSIQKKLLKEIADLVTDDVDRDGIAKALERICRNTGKKA